MEKTYDKRPIMEASAITSRNKATTIKVISRDRESPITSGTVKSVKKTQYV